MSKPLTWIALAAAAAAAVDAAGCNAGPTPAPTSRPVTATDAALNDPMNYKPQFNAGPPGGTGDGFDSGGFKRDLNNVFNP